MSISSQVETAGGLSDEAVNALKVIVVVSVTLLSCALVSSSFRLAVAGNVVALFGIIVVWEVHLSQRALAREIAKHLEERSR